MTGIIRVSSGFLEASRRLPAVQDRKSEVHQDQIWTLIVGNGEPLLTIQGHDDLEAGALEARLKHIDVVLVVFDIEDLAIFGALKADFVRQALYDQLAQFAEQLVTRLG